MPSGAASMPNGRKTLTNKNEWAAYLAQSWPCTEDIYDQMLIIVKICYDVFQQLGSKIVLLLRFREVLEVLEKVREVNRKNFLLCSSKSDLGVPSYDKKTGETIYESF